VAQRVRRLRWNENCADIQLIFLRADQAEPGALCDPRCYYEQTLVRSMGRVDQVVCRGTLLRSRSGMSSDQQEALDKLEDNELVFHDPGASEEESQLRRNLQISK